MNSDTGNIYDITEECRKGLLGLSKEEIENLVPFEVGEIVNVKGCKFKVRSVHPSPTNMITLEGIPK